MPDKDDDISTFLDGLSEREIEILHDMFGVDLSGGSKEEIMAALLQITREKIHRIEKKALRILRNSSGDPNDAA